MPWTLEIHMIDVGQGDSSLIVARHSSGVVRAIVVDAGKPPYAKIVDNYVASRGIKAVSAIVVSHYDIDHSAGVVGLLSAQIMWDIANSLGEAVAQAANQAKPGDDRYVQAVIYGVAAFLAMYGLANDLAAHDGKIKADPPHVTSYEEAATAAKEITDRIPGGAALVTSKKVRNRALDAAFKAATGPSVSTVDAMWNAVGSAVIAVLYPEGDANGLFDTGGRYADVTVVDLGDDKSLDQKDAYKAAVKGTSTVTGSTSASRPKGAFTRVRPDLGQEILWGTGPRITVPNGAPAVYVVARQREVWPDQTLGGVGQDPNLDSIGLLLRFNNFFFFTAGDLPSAGEDPLADHFRHPKNAAPFVPVDEEGLFEPIHLAAFKCGHHGAKESTSKNFLDMMLPAVALISVGKQESYDHPAQAVIERLEASEMVAGFLTNCHYPRVGIPASNHQDQLEEPDALFFVAGQPHVDNLAAGRVRGDVCAVVLEDASKLDGGAAKRAMVVSFTDTTSGPSRAAHELVVF